MHSANGSRPAEAAGRRPSTRSGGPTAAPCSVAGSGMATHSSSCGRHLAEVTHAPRRVALVAGEQLRKVGDRHALRLGPAVHVDEAAERVLDAVASRGRLDQLRRGPDRSSLTVSMRLSFERVVGRVVGRTGGRRRQPGADGSVQRRAGGSSSAAALDPIDDRGDRQLEQLLAELGRRFRRPAGHAVGRQRGRGVTEHEIGRCDRGRRRRRGGRGARARARARASPTSPRGSRAGRRRRAPTRPPPSGSSVHQSTAATRRSGRNRRR